VPRGSPGRGVLGRGNSIDYCHSLRPCLGTTIATRRRTTSHQARLSESLLELQRLTERLRRDCPWDREQTARTIVPHTVEEAYEVADAAERGDDRALLDELGDLLFQVYFLSLLLAEKGSGGLEEVARGVHAKLVQRHPHVFGGEAAASAGAVRRRWEGIKREQEGREGIFHDIPGSLPALIYARKIQRRAAAAGFEYPDAAGALGDLEEELGELKHELARAGEGSPEQIEENPIQQYVKPE